MSELESLKTTIINNVQRLCAHCVNGNTEHQCPLRQISNQIANLKGIPLIVNDEFRGIIIR